jgi:hypothetical protein
VIAVKFPQCRSVGKFLILASCFLGDFSKAAENSRAGQGASEIFSAGGAMMRLKIALPDSAVISLKKSPRTNVIVSVQEATSVYTNVLLHLKGSTGSFRPVDDKPSFTLHFHGNAFHGLRKIHLNNSVEDPTYLNEYLGSELFRAAGVPAGRVGHARVDFNGRELGLYALKEGLTEGALLFAHSQGELYEPLPGQDLNEPLRMVFGKETGRASLRALASALGERDPVKGWQAVRNVLDVDRFCSFIGLEVMLNHRDGYCLGKNNFRLYHDSSTDRFVFLPYGMDQLFGKANATLLPQMSGLVAARMLEFPEGRALYKLRLQQLATNIFQVGELEKKIDSRASFLKGTMSRQERHAFEDEVELLKNRIAHRHESVLLQINNWSREQAYFVQGRARLTNWTPVALGQKGHLNQTKDAQEIPVLSIQAGPGTAAAWKTRVWLPRGRYIFSGQARTTEVRTFRTAKAPGARLRVPGHEPDRSVSLAGTQAWRTLSIVFDIAYSEQLVEMLCELSADQGEAGFQLESLILEQVR